MSVQVEIVAEERPHAVIIPAAALVIQDDERCSSWSSDADSKAHKRPVAVGLTTRTEVEVTRGVTAGERVIVRGQDGVPEGAAVAVEAQMNPARIARTQSRAVLLLTALLAAGRRDRLPPACRAASIRRSSFRASSSSRTPAARRRDR